MRKPAVFGVWCLFLLVLVIIMQRDQCQAELNNHFSYAVLEKMDGLTFLVTSCHHVNQCTKKKKFGLSIILKGVKLNHNIIQHNLW